MDILQYPTVKHWISKVDGMFHLTEEEWTERLGVLGDFCATAMTEPDTMIADSMASRDAKNDYMRRLKRFAHERYPGARAAHDAENVVRSFFIHNGARVFVRPYQ